MSKVLQTRCFRSQKLFLFALSATFLTVLTNLRNGRIKHTKFILG